MKQDGGFFVCFKMAIQQKVYDNGTYFDLWYATGCGGNPGQVKPSQKVIIPGHAAFPFINLDKHSRLVISVGGEDLSVFNRDRCVPFNQGGHNPSSCFNPQRQWSNV